MSKRRKKKGKAYVSAVRGYRCYFDGCCEPKNPGGTAGLGAVIFKGDERVWEHSGMIPASPTTSNNVAEYKAFIAILHWLIDNGATKAPILIQGDSKLVIEQCFGTWKIHGGHYAELARYARVKVGLFSNLHGEWIPREENSIADELSKAELRKAGIVFRIQPEAA